MRLDAEDLMEDGKLKINRPKEKNKNGIIIGVVIAIIVTLTIICIIMILMKEIQPIDTTMKTYLNGEQISIDNTIFLIEDGKVYVSVKGIASYAGYEVHSGEYKIEAEDANKVFVENKQETASMFLNSAIISKVEPNTNDEYKNYTMSEPARDVNGDIYVISDGIQIACNMIVRYNASTNSMYLQTLPYIYETYNNAIQERGFIGISDDFENQKALLYDRIVVKNNDDKYGVIDSSGKEIVGTRYAYIQFDEYNKEFTITNAYNKVGIDYIDGETKINVNYDEIRSINKENGLYLVKSNGKYGIIDSEEKIIIHIEYDDIGVDLSPYITKSNSKIDNGTDAKQNNKNGNEDEDSVVKQYIFFDTLIPVMQNDLWGFFDVNGNRLSDMRYTSIGCKAKENKDKDNNNYNYYNTEQDDTFIKTTSNLLVIDEYELIVVEENKSYGIVNKSAQELFRPAAQDIYSITDAGVKLYYMLYNGNTYNLETSIFNKLNLIKKSVE